MCLIRNQWTGGHSYGNFKFKSAPLIHFFLFFSRIRHVDLFSEITDEMFLSHSEGKDRTVTIMKKINKSPKIEGTVLPAKSDSGVMLSQSYQDVESIDHLCINPIRRIGLIHK